MNMQFAKCMLHFANRLIPKKPNQLYFFSTSLYKDNIAAIVEELLRHEISKGFHIILDGRELREYKGSNIEHVCHGSLVSIWRFLRSKYVIYDNGIYGSRSTKRQVSVNTWHGMGLKRIGYYGASSKKTHVQTATHVLAYSPCFRHTMAYAFGVPPDNVMITGEPRNDYLLANNNSLEMFGVPKANYAKIIMWMPTYRVSSRAESRDDGAPYEYGIPMLSSDNIHVLDRYLSERRILLIVKYHSLQNIALPQKQLNSIRFLTSQDVMESEEPLYSLLSQSDALITDYSSVYLNYLLLNRPICFAYDDLELYASKRGFMFPDVESMMPGFKARSFDQLLQFIDHCSLGVDDYKQDRALAAGKYNRHNDNRNSYRLLKELGILS